MQPLPLPFFGEPPHYSDPIEEIKSIVNYAQWLKGFEDGFYNKEKSLGSALGHVIVIVGNRREKILLFHPDYDLGYSYGTIRFFTEILKQEGSKKQREGNESQLQNMIENYTRALIFYNLKILAKEGLEDRIKKIELIFSSYPSPITIEDNNKSKHLLPYKYEEKNPKKKNCYLYMQGITL